MIVSNFIIWTHISTSKLLKLDGLSICLDIFLFLKGTEICMKIEFLKAIILGQMQNFVG